MWSPLVLVLLVGAAVADQQHYGWKSGSEYHYQVEGRTLAALHQVADQYTGILMKAKLVLQPNSDSSLRGKISKAEYAQIHTQLPDGFDSDIPERKLSFQQFPMSSKSFELKMKNGVVQDMLVDKKAPTWEVNVLKSIASQLQVDTQGQNLIKSRYNQEPEGDAPNAVFKTMEDSVSGECEVLYDISPMPEYVLQSQPELAPLPHLRGDGQIIDIVKTKNFSNCEQRMCYHFGFTGMTDWEPGANDNGKFLARSSMSRVIIAGSLNRYTIQSSVTTNKVIVSPTFYETQSGMVVSQMNLTLEDVKSATDSIPSPSNLESTGKLVYSFNNPFSGNEQRRPNLNSGEENSSSSSSSSASSKSSSSSSSSSASDESQGFGGGRRRHRRSSNSMRHGKRQDDSSSDSSSGDDSSSSSDSSSSYSSSEEEYMQPKPKLNDAPEIPMLPFFVGYKGSSIQQSSQIHPTEAAKKLAVQIGGELQKPSSIPEEESLEKYSILASFIRTMNSRQIAEVQQELYQSDSKTDSNSKSQSVRRNAWAAFRDAVAQAGTGPALVSIKQWIENKKIKGHEAAHVVNSLAKNTRMPTPEYMDEFFSMATSSGVEKQARLNSTAILVFASLVRESQVSNASAHNRYPVHSFGRLSPKGYKAVTGKYIPYMAQQLKRAVQNADSPKIQTYIRALGNTGHPKILEAFEPFLEGQQDASTFQRLMMVASMDKLANLYPKLARSVLYKIYQNTGDAHEVRCAAVFQLMKTNPPASMLQRMAEFTNYDASDQVNAAVKSAIESAAELETYGQRELAHNAQAAKDLLNSDDFGLQYSQTYLRDYALQEMNLAYKMSAGYIGSDDSIVPQAAYVNLKRKIGEFNVSPVEVRAMVSSIDDLTSLIRGQVEIEGEGQQRYSKGGHKSGYKSGYKSGHKGGQTQWSAENIAQMLGIEPDEGEQLEGNVYINTGYSNHFLAFDNHTIEQIPAMLKSVAKALEHGESFNMTEFSGNELTLSFPTATGLPFFYSIKTPTLMKIGGEASAKSHPSMASGSSSVVKPPSTVNGSFDLHLTCAIKYQGRMGFIAPFEHQQYTAGVDTQMMMNLPISASVDVDAENYHVRVKLQPMQGHENAKLLHFSTKPFTSQDDILNLRPVALSKNTHAVHVRKPTRSELVVGEKTTGVAIRIQGESDENPHKNWYARVSDLAEIHDAISHAIYPWQQKDIVYRHYDVYLDSGRSSAKAVMITAARDELYATSQSSDYSNDSPSAQAPQPSSQKPDSAKRRKQFLKQAAAGISGARATVYDFGLDFLGKQDAQYAATAAFASSNVDAKSRALFYWNNNAGKSYEVCVGAETQTPNVPELDFAEAMNVDPTSEIEVDIRYGDSCKSGAKINIRGKGKQSKQRKEYLNNRPLAKECYKQMQEGNKALPACQNVTMRANLLDKAHISIDFDNVSPQAKNWTAKTLRFAQQVAYPYTSENMIDPQSQAKNKIDIDIQMSPSFKHANMSINAPGLDARFTNVELYEWAIPIVAGHPSVSVVERLGMKAFNDQSNPTCVLDKNQANTFDNTTYPIELGNCWHVMMTTYPQDDPDNNNDQLDISEDMRVSILSRDVGGDQKEVKITLGDNEIHLTPSGSHSGSRSGSRSGSHSGSHSKYPSGSGSGYGSATGYGSGYSGSGSAQAEVQVNGEHVSFSQQKAYYHFYQNGSGSHHSGSGSHHSGSGSHHSGSGSHQSGSGRHQSGSGSHESGSGSHQSGSGSHRSGSSNDVSGEIAFEIYELPDGSVKLTSEQYDLDATYDGGRIQVQASNKYRDSIRGLCGTFTGESATDFTSPKNCVLKNPDEFSGSYALTDQKCEGPAKSNAKKAKKAYCASKEYLFGNVVSDRDVGRNRKYNQNWGNSFYRRRAGAGGGSSSHSCRTSYHTKVVEDGDEICFSLRPIPTCASECNQQKKKSQDVEMHCVSNSETARRVAERIRKGANPDYSQKSVSKMMNFNIAVRCGA